jgi:hypothetical protein
VAEDVPPNASLDRARAGKHRKPLRAVYLER